MFVANRVQKIQENTIIDQWKYIKLKQNPANEALRGMKVGEMLESAWITEPAFLWEKENQWLTSNEEDHKLQKDLEVKKSVALATAANVKNMQTYSEKTNLAD